ncbi:hypothetical protein PIROE2DRAFT_8787 [Piromyces sp. E2]|nr:hypothetical protein PIROE2DRAFT_8787 [Piromyces sp. E2]|eukprot:OUM64472.1 hypothetical protein PIROE2DRAFT_8787 [Piromyces sp. E2]
MEFIRLLLTLVMVCTFHWEFVKAIIPDNIYFPECDGVSCDENGNKFHVIEDYIFAHENLIFKKINYNEIYFPMKRNPEELLLNDQIECVKLKENQFYLIMLFLSLANDFENNENLNTNEMANLNSAFHCPAFIKKLSHEKYLLYCGIRRFYLEPDIFIFTNCFSKL